MILFITLTRIQISQPNVAHFAKQVDENIERNMKTLEKEKMVPSKVNLQTDFAKIKLIFNVRIGKL